MNLLCVFVVHKLALDLVYNCRVIVFVVKIIKAKKLDRDLGGGGLQVVLREVLCFLFLLSGNLLSLSLLSAL